MDVSSTRPRRVAVLLAGGVGVRIGLDIPKQLIKVAGKTLLEHTLAALHQHAMVDEIVVMMASGHLDAVRAIVRDGHVVKVLGSGELTVKVNVTVHKFSGSAKEKIESAGGTATTL